MRKHPSKRKLALERERRERRHREAQQSRARATVHLVAPWESAKANNDDHHH